MHQLTEDPGVSVLVVEAGESDAKQIFSRLPAGWVCGVAGKQIKQLG